MIATSIKNRIASGKAWVDVLAIVALLLLHPVLYRLDMMRGFYSPDAAAYMEFAEHFLSNGLLYLERGTAGQGSVLPPIYPLLILITNLFVNDFIISSIVVSNVAAIVASIVFYSIIRRFGSPFFAFLGALAVQLNYVLNAWALMPLTEASFILILACSLWLMLVVLRRSRISTFALLGVFLSLTFLTRQIGLILLPFVFLTLILAEPRRVLVSWGSVTVGVALLLTPYLFMLHEQGRQIGADLSAFEPHWSKRDVILIDDVDGDVQEYLHRLNDTSVDDYGDVYVKRRLLRQLLPDSSAMLSQVEMKPPDRESNHIISRVVNIWSSLDRFDENLAKNVQHAADALGPFVCGVFLISLITPFLVGMNRTSLLARCMIGGFVLYYLFAISLLTGSVGRYVQVLSPFILLHIIIEAAIVVSAIQRKTRGVSIAPLAFLVVVAAIVFSQPADFSDVASLPKRTAEEFAVGNLRQFLQPRDPVMSVRPFHAYVVGGSWRVLPNDSLEKIAIYAQREKIPWLLVVRDASSSVVTLKLTQTWYRDPYLSSKYKDLVQLRAMSKDGTSYLFKFKADR